MKINSFLHILESCKQVVILKKIIVLAECEWILSQYKSWCYCTVEAELIQVHCSVHADKWRETEFNISLIRQASEEQITHNSLFIIFALHKELKIKYWLFYYKGKGSRWHCKPLKVSLHRIPVLQIEMNLK